MKNTSNLIFKTLVLLLPITFVLFMSCSQDQGPTSISPNQNGDMPAVIRDTSIHMGDYKTYNQGEWGTPPAGNNAGMYLKNNWNLLDTVRIGCDSTGGHTLTFTEWQAVTQFLPQGRIPAILDTSYVNPHRQLSMLAGQQLALALNIMFDMADSSFGNSPMHLKDLCVAYGPFAGWTVQQVFDEANRILGGCNSNYNIYVITYVVGRINMNFENGNQVGNYLKTCSIQPRTR
jgi:hypothetical protein